MNVPMEGIDKMIIILRIQQRPLLRRETAGAPNECINARPTERRSAGENACPNMEWAGNNGHN